MKTGLFSFPDFADFLRELAKRSDQQFLVGGQAVNFWAEVFDRKGHHNELPAMRPFTSKDCDVWVGGSLWNELKATEKGRLICGQSPADGQLGILKLGGDPVQLVDFLSGIYGFRPQEQKKLYDRALMFDGVKVIDPISLFRSKCHCFLHLDQADRQDERHVRIMALVLPEYLALLAGEVESGGLSARSVIREIKWLEKTVGLAACRRAMEMLGIAKNSLIPFARLKRSEAEELRRYAAPHDN